MRKGPRATPFPSRAPHPPPGVRAPGPGRAGKAQAAPGGQDKRRRLQSGRPRWSRPCPGPQPGLPGRDAAPLLAPHAQAAAPAGHPYPLRHAAPAHPQVAPGACRTARVGPRIPSDPSEAALSLSPERPLDWSASRNLSPRTWCRARRVLRSRSALGG